jgi:hypothetical protein
MAMCVVLAGPMDALSSAIVQRGILAGYRFFVSRDAIEPLRQAFSTECTIYPEALALHEDAPLDAVLLLQEGESLEGIAHGINQVMLHPSTGSIDSSFNGVNIVVHDLLPAEREKETMHLFVNWLEAIEQGLRPSIDNTLHHWCSINDVASALVRALPHLPSTNTTFHLAGRRGWTLEETWDEFEALANRTLAGERGTFRASHLSTNSGPPVVARPIQVVPNEHLRPDIGPFHRLLEETTGEGWRPTTTLRQSLMLVLASLRRVQ